MIKIKKSSHLTGISMYRNLTFSGVKGTSQTIQLDNVIVITGPNESGKSAAASALQLAATGRCEIGAQASAQQKWISGKAASIHAWGNGIEATWQISNGKKHWEDPETQGGMPATVEDFWGLTGAERLKLIAPDGALTSIETEISSLEKRKKELKSIIDAIAPPPPEQYDGPSVGDIEGKIKGIERQLSDADAYDKYHAGKKQNEAIRRQLGALTQIENDLSEAKARLKAIQDESELFRKQLAIYQEQQASVPRIVRSAKERGLTLRAAVSDTLNLVREVLVWTQSDPGVLVEALLEVVPDVTPQLPEPPVYKSSFPELDGKTVTSLSNIIATMLDSEAVKVAKLQASHQTSVDMLSMSPPKLFDDTEPQLKPMSLDERMAAQAEVASLKQQINKANAWAAYGESLERQMKQRNDAFAEMEDIDSKLASAKRRLTETVFSLKGPVESLANDMLKAADRSPLYCDVSQTGRGWSLDVSIDGIAIESLAKSKKLLYGLCLLAAIHELSSAKSPVLLVECAEMDPSNLERAIEAMRLKKKGNVILEHWAKPNSDVHIVDLNYGVLV
jgi:hypothetical protein